MLAKGRPADPPPPEPHEFRSVDEIDAGISKLERRIRDLENLDVRRAIQEDTDADDVVRSNVRASIREIFGTNSHEFAEHQHIQLWAGPMYMGMHPDEIVAGTERGRRQVIVILKGLVGRLQEKRADLEAGSALTSTPIDRLNLHPQNLRRCPRTVS